MTVALAAASLPGQGVLVHLNLADVATFNLRHTTLSLRLNPTRDLYLVTATDGRTDQQLLTEIQTDPVASNPILNAPVTMTLPALDGQSTASVLNGSTSTSTYTSTSTTSSGGLLGSLLQPVLNLAGNLLNPLLGTVLNIQINTGGVSSGGLLNSQPTYFYGSVVPQAYPNQPTVSQISAGASAHNLATGQGVEVALIDNGLDPFNPVLMGVTDGSHGYNFYDNSANWSAYADLADGPDGGSNLDGQSTASVLNGQSTASVLNGSTCQQEFSADGSRLNQSTASVLNGQSTASVLNSEDSTTVINELNIILACDPEFGHGTSVAGLIHLVAPQAKILPIKAFGPGGSADVAAIYQSITYAIDHHVQVMNLSFSATAASPVIEAAIREAVQDGIVVVAAAGNDGVSTAVYPASLPGVAGAGAVDGTQAGFPRAPYSNFDPAPGVIENAAVAAPGTSVFTTYPGGGQIWATATGTSFSTPLIAGEAALLAQLHQTGPAALRLMENTANPAITGDAHGELGHGMVNVESALRSASSSLLSWLLW